MERVAAEASVALVLEDDASVRDPLIALLRAAGLQLQLLGSLAQAAQAIGTAAPDLIIIDHEVAGERSLDFVRSARAQDPLNWIPIIMLGEDHGSVMEFEALRAGCDDYLVKPVAPEALHAKLSALLRMSYLRRLAERQRAELAEFIDRAEAETELATFLLSRMSHLERLDEKGIDYYSVPADSFSGDLIGVTRSTTGDVYGLLADATGHGLAAAINLIPLTAAFYAMASKGFNLLTITEQLNKVVKEYSLPDRFVAVTLARFVRRESRLEIVNAGNPAALLVDAKCDVVREFSSGSIPLGILDSAQFKPRVDTVELAGSEQLVLYSDGPVEACNGQGVAFGRAALDQAMKLAQRSGDTLVTEIRTALTWHCAGFSPADDVSILVLRAPPSATAVGGFLDSAAAGAVQAPARVQHAEQEPEAPVADEDHHWFVEVCFTAAELRRTDVVPVIVNLTRTIGLHQAVEARIFTVLSELFSNALEHGLLGLMSAIKHEPDGFERYLELRAQRLAALEQGRIAVRIDHWTSSADSGTLKVDVHDSGPGFDHRGYLAALAVPAAESTGAPRPSGRGLVLLQALSKELTFNEAGNRAAVTLTYG